MIIEKNNDIINYIEKEESKIYVGLRIKKSESNCKLTTIEYFSSLFKIIDELNKDEANELFNYIKKMCNRLVYITISDKENIEYIEKVFGEKSIISKTIIPFGDDSGFQYHIIVLNYTITNNFETLDNIIKNGVSVEGYEKGSKILTKERKRIEESFSYNSMF